MTTNMGKYMSVRILDCKYLFLYGIYTLHCLTAKAATNRVIFTLTFIIDVQHVHTKVLILSLLTPIPRRSNLQSYIKHGIEFVNKALSL